MEGYGDGLNMGDEDMVLIDSLIFQKPNARNHSCLID